MKPDWEVMMGVICPSAYGKRPRRLSVYAISAMLLKAGTRDMSPELIPYQILKEMELSKKVSGYTCPDVQTEIFFLDEMAELPGMITDGDNKKDPWSSARARLAKYPFPETQGFRRFAKRNNLPYQMEEPFDPEDFPYRDEVLRVLAEYKESLI